MSSQSSQAFSPEAKVLLDEAHITEKLPPNATVNERKAIRSQKLKEFHDKAEEILGPSFEEDRWKYNNKDDEKKEITRLIERRLSHELNLPDVMDL